MKPAIVIVAYNRPDSLQRLLNSIGEAQFQEKNIPLVISIDAGENQEVINVAEAFNWNWGPKQIIPHQKHLGLREHILSCGDLTVQYGSVIILEDDLLVSPHFYAYASEALDFYRSSDAIGGISLYSYDMTESQLPFYPYNDEADVYFIQIASSWGQAWTADHWTAFREWFKENPAIDSSEKLPGYLLEWNDTGWKKHFIRYLMNQDKYFVFPRFSLSTNFEDPGTNAVTQGLFQVSLLEEPRKYKLLPIERSDAVYDAWFEMKTDLVKNLDASLKKYDLTIDLYGTKDIEQIETAYVISTKPASKAEHTYGLSMVPNVLNIKYHIKGHDIRLARKENLDRTSTPFQKSYYKLASIREKIFKDILDEKIEKKSDELNQKHRKEIDRVYNELDQKHQHELKKIYKQHEINVQQEVKKSLDNLQFTLEYPLISVVTVISDENLLDLQATVQSVLQQDYPRMEYIIVNNSPDETIAEYLSELEDPVNVVVVKKTSNSSASNTGFQTCQGEIMGWINPGAEYFENSFKTIAKIFNYYHDITWLCGIPSGLNGQSSFIINDNINPLRWNCDEFFRAEISLLKDFFKKENIFWRKYLWKSTGAGLDTSFQYGSDLELYARFWGNTNLYPVITHLGGSPVSEIEDNKIALNAELDQIIQRNQDQIFSSKLTRLLQPSFKKNIPWLRKIYLEMSPHPDVIRFDTNNKAFYLSRE